MKLLAQSACTGAALAALLWLAPGCQKQPDDVLARVGGQAITIADFQAEMQRRRANHQPLPERAVLLEEMVARAVLVEQAKAKGFDRADDVRRTFEEVLIAKLKETELEPSLAAATVSPAEIRAAYEKDAARFTQPAKVQLAIIFVAADAKLETNRLAEISARAEAARQRALALPATEKDFGRVAADFSEDQSSRYRGGEAGWFTTDLLADRWPTAVVAAGRALKNVGEVSGLIRTADGFYLVKKMAERAAVVAPLAQAQAGLERQLLTAKRAQAEAEFKQTVRRSARVQTYPDLLGQVEYPTPGGANATPAAPPALPSSP